MEKEEIAKLRNYLRKLFRLDTIELERRPIKKDSVEVKVGDETIGLIFKDEEEGETSYHFEMCILDIDLED